jgi:hypothetical protein
MNALIISLLATLIPFNGLALWAFLRFAPEGDSPGRRQVFNAITLAIVPVVCAVFSLWLSTELGTQVEEYWRPVLTAMGWISAFPVLLLLASGVRFYLWFRRDEAEIDPNS